MKKIFTLLNILISIALFPQQEIYTDSPFSVHHSQLHSTTYDSFYLQYDSTVIKDQDGVLREKYIATYNEKGRIIQNVEYEWIMGNDIWKEKKMFEYDYDTNGKMILYAYYSWNNENWQIDYKNERIYNEDKQLIQQIYYGIISETGELVADRKYKYTYDEYGNEICLLNFKWNNVSQTWEKSIINSGREAFFVKTDVSIPSDIINMVKVTVDKYGTIDILINNAGFGIWKSLYDITLEEWENVINTNLRGSFLCSREAARIMRKAGRGAIVNIASTRAMMSEPDSELYAASKGGIVSLTHSLAASLSPDGIQVNCISPGWIETVNYDNLREMDHNQHFSNRVGIPDDIARTCLFLTRPENNFINGQNIVVDGGMTKKMIYEPD